jgi:uncharacterized protein (DUF1697 family)
VEAAAPGGDRLDRPGYAAGMQRFAAFLRGMNLGRNRRIENERLRSEFERLELADVATFRASGNVVFAAEEGDERALGERIESGLREALGYEVPVFLRSARELAAIAAAEPFDERALAASKGKLQVMLLPRKPPAEARRQALALDGEDDRLALGRRELFWLPQGGMSESELDLRRLDALLGPTTIRTMGTIEQIVAKHL